MSMAMDKRLDPHDDQANDERADGTFSFEDEEAMALDDLQPITLSSLETRSVELHIKPQDDLDDMLYAARFGDVEQLQWFVLRGADLSKADFDKRTLLHVGAAEGRVGVVEFLIGQKVDVNAVDRWGNTPLEEAINNGHFETAQLIRAHGGTPKHELGDRLCQYASKGDLDNLKLLLLPMGANVNSRSTRSKHTALHMAAAEGHVDIVKFLLDHGAEVNIVDRWGHTPLKNAVDNHHLDIATLLTQHGAEAVTYDTDALELNKACAKGELHKVKALIEWRGLDVNTIDYDGRAPLVVAASEGKLDVVQYLVSKGANVEIKDRWGFNAYQNALQNGHTEIAHFLNHNAQFVLKTVLSVDDEDESDFPLDKSGTQIICCQRFGKNRSTVHKAFKQLLQQISRLGDWDFSELWTINQQWQVLQFCRESCCIGAQGEREREMLTRFADVSQGLLIEYNIFFGGNVLTKRRPALFTKLQSLPQFNFFRSPMCRVAGLKTCLALPVSPGENSDEILGAVILFSSKDVVPTDRTVAPLLECISTTAKLVTSLARLPKDLISMSSYATVVLEAISPEANETGTLVDDMDYRPIVLEIGALEPVFGWGKSMSSEDHKAAMDIFHALAENAAAYEVYPQWKEAKEQLLLCLRFLVSVSPVARKETPVKGIAEEALKALEQSGTVVPLPPPYFEHSDSPVMDALREMKSNLISEFEAYSRTHDMSKAIVDDIESPSFQCRLLSSDVFRAFGRRDSGGSQRKMSLFGQGKKAGPSECERAAQFLNQQLAEGVGPNLRIFDRQVLLQLHACLSLDKNTVKEAFRRQWVVGSFQFYRFYRVFSPHEEIPRAIDMVLDTLNTEMRYMCGALKAYYAYHALVHFIHPFHDGNGRISRLIANVVLKAHGYLGVLTYQDKIIQFQEYLDRVLSSAETYKKMKLKR